MQRRLIIALVATALAAIVLVGVGVLGFASIGAELDAQRRLETQIAAVSELVEGSGRPDTVGPAIGRLSDSLDGTTIDVGVVGPAGGLRSLGRGRNNSSAGPALSGDEVAMVRSGETVFTRLGGQLRGVGLLDADLEGGQAGVSPVVIVSTRVDTIGREARLWFVLSAALVVVIATLVAAFLARRIVRPIQEATAATEAIAAGDLAARVPVAGTDELADLGAGINHMAAELERGRAAEQQFLLSVSHDLRTPLTALRGYGEALEDGTATDIAKAGAVISHHANRLGRLVGDLLDLGKLDAQQFQLHRRPIEAATVVTAAVDGARPVANERGIDITTTTVSAIISVDPDRLGQIVANLIENALAFASTTIEVSITNADDTASITVADDGPGIEAADLPHVFERLYVTKLVPERSESPSGLGLAIVRELARAMDGHVEATTSASGGAAMIVRFPVVPLPVVDDRSVGQAQ